MYSGRGLGQEREREKSGICLKTKGLAVKRKTVEGKKRQIV